MFILYRSLMRKCLLPSRTKEIRKTCIKLFIATKYTTAIGSDMKINQWFIDNLSIIICSSLERNQWIDVNSSNRYASTASRIRISSCACSQKVLSLTTIGILLVGQSKRDTYCWLKLTVDFRCSQVNSKQFGNVTNDPLKVAHASIIS